MVPDPPEEENDPAAKDIAAAVDTEDQQYVEEMPRHYHAHMTLAERRSRGTEDKAAGQCWGNLGVQQVDSLTTLIDLAVADATVHSYRRPPPPCCLPPVPTPEEPPLPGSASEEHLAPVVPPRRRGRRWRESVVGHPTPWRWHGSS